jgi:hypothetical protein
MCKYLGICTNRRRKRKKKKEEEKERRKRKKKKKKAKFPRHYSAKQGAYWEPRDSDLPHSLEIFDQR